MQAALQKQGQDIASEMNKLQARMSNLNGSKDKNLISHSQANNLGSKLQNIQGTLNSWLQKVEDKVNTILNSLNSKADKRDLQSIRRQFSQNLKSSVEKFSVAPYDFGKRASTPKQENQKLVSKEDLKQIKQQVNKNVQDGVDRMGNLVRQYLSSLQKLQKKVNVLQSTISRPASLGVSPKHIITPKNNLTTKQTTATTSVNELRPPIIVRRQSSGRRESKPSSTINKRSSSRSLELSRINPTSDTRQSQNGIVVGSGDLLRSNKSRTLENSPMRQSVSFNLQENRELAKLGRRVQVGGPYSTKNSRLPAKPIIKRIYQSEKKEAQPQNRQQNTSDITSQRQIKNMPNMRRSYLKSRPQQKDYDRSLSQGARVLKNTLQKLSRSQSKSKRQYRPHLQQFRNSFQRSRDRNSSNRSFNRDLEQTTINEEILRNSRVASSSFSRQDKQVLSPIQLNRRVGGLVNRSRDWTPKNKYHHSRDYSAPEPQNYRGRLSNFNRSPLSRSACKEQNSRRSQSVSFRQHDRHHSVGSHRSKKQSVSFSFSPYSTKRSRLGELQARLKRDKQLKQKMIQELQKGHNSSIDTPKFHSKRNSASSAISRTLQSQRKHSDRVNAANSHRTPKQDIEKVPKARAYSKKIPNSASSFKQKRAKLDNLYQEFAALADHQRK